MVADSVKVLYADSTESVLPRDILDVITSLVDCGAVTATSFHELTELETKEAKLVKWTDEMLADLAGYQERVQTALDATVVPSSRSEIHELGTETTGAAMRTIEASRLGYQGEFRRKRAEIETRRRELLSSMHDAIESFVLPLRNRVPRRVVARIFDGKAYRDEASLELGEGVRPRLSLTARDQASLRKVRALVGKGAKLQIGVRRTRIRKIEEPATFAIDDQVVLEFGVAPSRGHIVMAKKPGAPKTRIDFTPQADGSIIAEGTRPDGVSARLPASNADVVKALWAGMRKEADRVIASPARLTSVSVDQREASGREDMLSAVERIVGLYRPMVAKIAARSSNRDELALKVAQPDGRREEVWLKRADLADRFVGLTPELRKRVDIPALHADTEDPEAVAVAPPVRSRPVVVAFDGTDQEKLREALLSDPRLNDPRMDQAKTTNFRSIGPLVAVEPEEFGVPKLVGVPVKEITEDISLDDLEIVGEDAPTPAAAAARSSRSRLPRPSGGRRKHATGSHPASFRARSAR